MLSIAIVEDEDSDAKSLESCLNRYSLETGEKFGIVRFDSANALMENYKPMYDIIFMDIILPKMNGMDVAKRLRETDNTTTLIFVTNMIKFAVKGYEVDALDFIIKPIKYNAFVMKMKRAVSVAKNRKCCEVTINADGVLRVISATDIYYIEVNQHNVIYHTAYGKFTVKGSLKSIDKLLPKEIFARCNVCYSVNLRYVSEVQGNTVVVAGDRLYMSRAKRKPFLEALTDYLGRNK